MISINGNFTSSTNNFQSPSTSTSLIAEQWKEWAKYSRPGRGEQRDIALVRLMECLDHQSTELNLQGLNLRELPSTLPDGLQKLNVSNNRLIHLPEKLPSGLEILCAANNQLTHLPAILPTGLKELDVNDNQLTQLPAMLPSGLDELTAYTNQLTFLPEISHTQITYLNINNNQLTRLPENLPLSLDSLFARNNQLTQLPDRLPPSLTHLHISDNRLTHLPAILPDGLLNLFVCNNNLTHLPETLPFALTCLSAGNNQLTYLPQTLPSGLDTLYVNNNQLTHLPETLPSALTSLDACSNQLTHLPETLPAGLTVLLVNDNQLTHLPETLPPRLIGFNAHNNPLVGMGDADSRIDLEPSSPLIEALYSWGKTSDIKQWKKIAKEENADHFSHFLNKLHKHRNAANASLHRIVSEWLTELAKEENREIRAQTFAIAQMGSESCVDRASYYFNQMHSLLIEHRLTKPSVPISEIINTLRSLFRLQELEKISADHAKQRRLTAPGFEEDIEIYLAYQCKLKDELALPVHTELQFETLANLTQADIEKAKRQIVKTEQEEFLRHLVTHSEVWQKKIEAWDGQKWALANERYLDEIASDDFQQTVEEALKREGISTVDEDAMRIMQQKWASDRLFQIRYPLTKTFLKEQNALSLIDGMHP